MNTHHNRIVERIEQLRLTLTNNPDLTPEKIEATRQNLDLPLDEYFAFQQVKSRAQLAGIITYDEAMTIYSYLGEAGPDNFNSQPLEVKAVLTKMLAELLSLSVQGAF